MYILVQTVCVTSSKGCCCCYTILVCSTLYQTLPRPRLLAACFARHSHDRMMAGAGEGKYLRLLRRKHLPNLCQDSPTSVKSPTMLSSCLSVPRNDVHGATVDLSLSSANKRASTAPCTNLPLKCKLWEQGTYGWKYGIPFHMLCEHPNLERLLRERNKVAIKFVEDCTVSHDEKNAVLK